MTTSKIYLSLSEDELSAINTLFNMQLKTAYPCYHNDIENALSKIALLPNDSNVDLKLELQEATILINAFTALRDNNSSLYGADESIILNKLSKAKRDYESKEYRQLVYNIRGM